MALAFITSGVSWPGVATNGANIKVEAIGGGAGGAGGSFAAGGAGAYALVPSVAYTSNTAVTVAIGGGGAGSSTNTGASGTDTNWSSGVVIAKAGVHNTTTTGGPGGAAASCTPSTGAFSGGAGGTTAGGTQFAGTGGGGAGGPGGAGQAGATQSTVGSVVGGGGGGGAGGGSATGGSSGGTASGGAGGTAQDGTAGGAGGNPGAPGSHGSGGGGGFVALAASAGGAGGAGIEWDATHGAGGGGGGGDGLTAGGTAGNGGGGGLYGGGGGSGGSATSTGGNGGQGIIVVTYTAPATGNTFPANEVRIGPPMPGVPWQQLVPQLPYTSTAPPAAPQTFNRTPGNEIRTGPPLPGVPWQQLVPQIPYTSVQGMPAVPAINVTPGFEVHQGPPMPGAPWTQNVPTIPGNPMPATVKAPRLKITKGPDTYRVPQSNLFATGPPGVSNDATQGYTVSSPWFDLINQVGYVCVSNAVGAAVWANLKSPTITLTGDVTGSGAGSVATTIGANKVTYAKMQKVAGGAALLGDPTGAGPIQEIHLGAGLAFAAGPILKTVPTPVAQEAGGDVVTSSSAFSNVTSLFFNVAIKDIWVVEYHLWCTGSVGGMVFQLTGPASPFFVRVFTQGDTTGVGVISSDSQTAFGTPTQAYIAGAFSGLVVIKAAIEVGLTAGTVQLQFASNVNTQTNTILHGSFMTPTYVTTIA